MANIPYYKYTYAPQETKTDTMAAYYGAQAQRSRRESAVDSAFEKYKSGLTDWQDYDATVDRILGTSVGMPERLNRLYQQQQGRETYAGKEYEDLTREYEGGQITYDQYIQQLKRLGYFLQSEGEMGAPNDNFTGGTSLGTGASTDPSKWMTDQIVQPKPTVKSVEDLGDLGNITINGMTLNDIFKNVTNLYNQGVDTQKEADYAAGHLSFEDYAKYLEERLQSYAQGTEGSAEAQSAWKSAYNEGLRRMLVKEQGLYENGDITLDEWNKFREWYGQQTEAGSQMAKELPTFTYQVANNIFKKVSPGMDAIRQKVSPGTNQKNKKNLKFKITKKEQEWLDKQASKLERK